MKRALLLGSPASKRTLFLEQAACSLGLHLSVLDWNQTALQDFPFREEECFLKIDPPSWKECSLARLKDLTSAYEANLHLLAQKPFGGFLNRPEDILSLLDKRTCKGTLKAAGLSVTEELEENVSNGRELLTAMEKAHICQIFLKPLQGSGAAGVTALRFYPKTGRMAAYSCAYPGETGLVNTKKLRFFQGREEVLPLLDQLLSMDCIAERWHSKAEYQGMSYDLRAVCQGGKVDFLLARLSKGPITNLHLNNRPLRADQLGLPSQVLSEISVLCAQASALYPGLFTIGIDILLEKNSLKPRIIEMNGQGDLLYEDIYHDNAIYLHQAQKIREWMEQ